MDGRTDAQPHIFISYRNDDEATVRPVIAELERQGYRVWYDVDGIGPGGWIASELQRNIENCAVFLAFLSKNYCDSRWCMDEISLARKYGKWVLPVKLEGARLENGLDLLLAQYNIVPWQDTETLIRQMRRIPECEKCRTVPTVKVEALPKPSPTPEHAPSKPSPPPKPESAPEPSPSPETEPTPKPSPPPETEPTPEPSSPSEPEPTPETQKKQIKGKPRKFFPVAAVIFVILALAAVGVTFAKAPLSEWMESRRILNEQGWILKDGVLTISKGILDDTGRMPDYRGNDSPPWAEQRDEITKAVIKTGIPNIGIKAFRECKELKTVSIPDSVIRIDWCAFCGCTGLKTFTIPDSVTYVGLSAFIGCSNLSTVYILGDSDSVVINNSFPSHTTVIYGPPPEDAAA